MLYCWPRQIGTPQATTTSSAWLASRYGMRRQKRPEENERTGDTPKSRYSAGDAR